LVVWNVVPGSAKLLFQEHVAFDESKFCVWVHSKVSAVIFAFKSELVYLRIFGAV